MLTVAPVLWYECRGFTMCCSAASLGIGFLLMASVSVSGGPAETGKVQPLRPSHVSVRVALAQIPVEDGNLEKNMRLAEKAAEQAAQENVDFLNLPEAADWGWLYQQARRDALPIPGKYTDFLSGLAKRHHLWISAGCLEKDGDNTFNSAVIIDRAGRIVLKHRKIDTLPWLTKHLYDQGRSEDIKAAAGAFEVLGPSASSAMPRARRSAGSWAEAQTTPDATLKRTTPILFAPPPKSRFRCVINSRHQLPRAPRPLRSCSCRQTL